MAPDPLAVVGGRLATGLADLTSDLGALDGTGFWAVAISFEGEATCARFDRVRPARPWPGRPWQGPPAGSWRTSLDAPAYAKAMVAVKEAIAAGDVYQVNLTRRLSAPAPAGADVAALGAALAMGNPAPYAAVLRVPAAGVHIASASPERFLRRVGRFVESRPIKGTAAEPGGFTAKDRAENVMIVDLVRNDLGRVCDFGSVEVTGLCQAEAHPGLHHLVSTVRGRLREGATWADLVSATFPPGSVTGAPKLAALQTISQLEPVRRGPYCGAIGWVDADAGEGDLNVAIRTFWLQDDELHLGTGGAVTWDSTPEGEWEETELKARRLLTVVSS
ncbi:MAG TPA: anthranilate synthase component I family protein [Acidimicrobiales bacterium]|nr:anthranilate synthase component I family protein [Acidimicrobiales bacterium]